MFGPEGPGGYRSALRSRDLRVLLGSELVSASGSWAYNVALLVLLYDRTHSTAWVAAGAFGRFLPSLLFSAYGGVLADRFERVRLMTWINVIAMLLQLGLAVAAWRAAPAVVAVALASLTSLVTCVYSPAVQALIPEVTAEDDLAAANALAATVDNLVVVAGPAVGGLLLLAGGPALAIAVNALTFAVAALWLPRMAVRSKPSDVTGGGQARPWHQVADGFRALASSAPVAAFVTFSVLASFVYGTDTVLFIPISVIQLHTGASGYGYLLAGLGVGGIVGAAVVNQLAARPRLAWVIFGGLAVYCLPTAALIVVHQPAIGFIAQVIRGAGTLVVDTLAITALQRSAPKEMVARVFGAFFAIAIGAIALGSLVTPLLLRAGLHLTMLACGVGIPALCLLLLPVLLRADRVAATTAASVAARVAILEPLGLFRNASRAGLEALAAAATEVTVPAGAVIIAEGDHADALFVLTSGLVGVSSAGEAGMAPVHLRTLGPGSYLGEIGLLGGVPRTATVTAQTTATLLRISDADFLDALTTMSASPSLLHGAQARLTRTHPTSEALAPLLTAHGADSGARRGY
jgi:predicted MFS family arabinose efflux permease